MPEIFIKDQKNEYKEWQVEPKKHPDFNKHYGRCEWQGLRKGLKKGGIIEACVSIVIITLLLRIMATVTVRGLIF